MKKIYSLLFSSKTTLILLLLFTVSIAAATFVEDVYDTKTAQILIYSAWWFELIIGLLVLNYIGQLKQYNFFSRGKIGGLIMHTGFVLLIIGAAVTRYFGQEGTMHIREEGSSNSITTYDPYLHIKVSSPKGDFTGERVVKLSSVGGNHFSKTVESGYDKPVKISFDRFIKNAGDTVIENLPDGEDMLAIQISSGGNGQGVYLKKGERINRGGVYVSFADTLHDSDVVITEEQGKLIARSKSDIFVVNRETMKPDSNQKGTEMEFRANYIFQNKDVLFTLVKFYRSGKLDFKKIVDDGHDHGIDVLTINVGYNDRIQKVNLTESSEPNDPPKEVSFGDLKVSIKYGVKEIGLPFSLKLNDFILDRYAGSNSPLSFASEVTVQDTLKNTNFNQRIFMNHVLDYQGYRFFQSSYDTDEKGTILSVNRDFWGTWISYTSYFLLFVGFVMVMFTKNSRYHFLSIVIRKLREKRKTVLTLFAFMLCGIFAQAQAPAEAPHVHNHVVRLAEAEKFGTVLVQSFDGRLEPVHTLAYEVMHKISKKDKFDFEGKEPVDAMQVLIDVIADPEHWKKQKMIYIKEAAISSILGIEGKYASFNDFLENDGGQYKLAAMVEKSFQKSPAQQNIFDRELIKVDERVNLFYMLLQGSLLKILPESNTSNKWVDWTDSISKLPLTGTINVINNDLKLTEFNYSNILKAYFQALMAGSHSGDYSKADQILGYIKNIQSTNIDAKKFPSESRIKAEISYNKSEIFNRLKYYYALASFLLIIFAFTDNVRSKSSKWLNWAQNISLALLGAIFLYHTYGMIIRWYLAGHAPWSNGYETLIFIAWSTVLAGFFFIQSSKIVQAATAFLAYIILMVAGLSNYDPQITNLQPVLKSYWLIIHVAVIIIGYGFLALGFILGITNMFLYLFKSRKNVVKTDLLISELTYINEKNLQLGLFMVTIGTFLGGIWANESWGRYWGWDAKETWALIIVIAYTIILHLRLVPKLRSSYIFNVSSILGFTTVLMTFIGVNYFFSKGLHSYASDVKAIFPMWGWVTIVIFIIIMVLAGIKEIMFNKNTDSYNKPQEKKLKNHKSGLESNKV